MADVRPSIDVYLDEVLADARALFDAHPDPAVQALAAAVLDLHAQLAGGGPLPFAWRDPGAVSPVERLEWVCRRIYGRLAGGPVRVTVRQLEVICTLSLEERTDLRLYLGYDSSPSLYTPAPPRTYWAVELSDDSGGITGDSAATALGNAIALGVYEVTQLYGAHDAAAVEARAWLREAGYAMPPDETLATWARQSPRRHPPPGRGDAPDGGAGG